MATKRYVYILEEHIPYEGEVFHGCFTTWLKAEACKNRLLAQWKSDVVEFAGCGQLLIRKEVMQ
jgi:hypothetical protein